MGKSAKKKEKKKKSPVPSQITTLLRAEAGAAGIGQGDLSGIREEMNQTAGCLHGPVATPRKPSRMQIYIWRTVDDDFFPSANETQPSPGPVLPQRPHTKRLSPHSMASNESDEESDADADNCSGRLP